MQPFVVRIVDLKAGLNEFSWHIGREFFEEFGNSEIIGADFEVDVRLDWRGVTASADCEVRGRVTVACDRCLEELEIPVTVSFSESYVAEGTELDLSQDVYDYVCVSLPLQRVHDEGECNPETTGFLSK